MFDDSYREEVHPVGTRILIKVDPVEEKTQGGIVIPKSAVETEIVSAESGTVVAIGDIAFQGYGEPWCEVGDHVYFLRHAGVIKKIGEEDYRIINDVDLIAISKKDYLKNKGEVQNG
jgi:chaperonin GroES